MLQALFVFERNPAVPAAGFFYQIPDKDHSNKLAFLVFPTQFGKLTQPLLKFQPAFSFIT